MATEYIEETIGYVKGPKGDPGVQGNPGIQGPPGVTDFATTSTAGLVRIGADHKISDAGVLSLDTETTKASTLAELVLDGTEAWATTLGKLAKAVSVLSTINGAYFDKSNVYNNLDKAASGFALDARQGKALKNAIDTINGIFDVAEYKILQKNGNTSDNNTIMTGQAAGTVKIYWGQNEQNAPATNSLHTILSAKFGSYGQQYAFYSNKAYFRGWSESGGFGEWTYVPTMVNASITGTTSAQGNLMILGNGSGKMVCATSGSKICIPFLSGAHWFVKVFDTSMNLVPSTEVTVDFTYFL